VHQGGFLLVLKKYGGRRFFKFWQAWYNVTEILKMQSFAQPLKCCGN